MLAATNERHDLRAAIDDQLRTDQDLDAFLVDFFPGVYRRCSSGMDRTAKVNLLFAVTATDEIADKLGLRSEHGRRPTAWQKRLLRRLLLVVIVGLVVGWSALQWRRQPPATGVAPLPAQSVQEERPVIPYVTTYRDADTFAARQEVLRKRYEAQRLKRNEIRLKPSPKVGLRILNYHWMNRKQYPPILDVLIENKTNSDAVITSVNANIIEYYPFSTDGDGEIQKEIAIIDINLPSDAGNHKFILEDPVKINPKKTGRVKFRFLDSNEEASARQLKLPYYKFDLGINMADEAVLVITNLSLFRAEFPD